MTEALESPTPDALDVSTPVFDPYSLLEGVLSTLDEYASTLAPEAREQAAMAFVRSLEWMQANPESWRIKPPIAHTYISQLDKPPQLIVGGRVVNVYKAQTIDPASS
nr:hypothetical protein [uncultured Pseudomonas sp.]